MKITSVFGFAFQPILPELTTDRDPDWVKAMVGSKDGQESAALNVAASLAIADFLYLVQQ